MYAVLLYGTRETVYNIAYNNKVGEPMKIAIIGYAGAGKSTLARQLGQLYGCAVLHLDSVHFSAGWQERADTDAKREVAAFMQQSSWIIDGNYSNFYQAQRLAEADKIIFMNFPRRTCLAAALKRNKMYKGHTRPDMADGCLEKIDAEFIRWILIDGRRKKQRRRYADIAAQYQDKITILKNHRDTAACLQALQSSAQAAPQTA